MRTRGVAPAFAATDFAPTENGVRNLQRGFIKLYHIAIYEVSGGKGTWPPHGQLGTSGTQL